MFVLICRYTFLYYLGISMGVKTNDKRLLLRDQDVIGARFSNIETRQIN